MAPGNGTWMVRGALILATAGILGAVGTYAQVRDNTSDLKKVEVERQETKVELEEIKRAVNANATTAAVTQAKVEAIYDVVVKDQE